MSGILGMDLVWANARAGMHKCVLKAHMDPCPARCCLRRPSWQAELPCLLVPGARAQPAVPMLSLLFIPSAPLFWAELKLNSLVLFLLKTDHWSPLEDRSLKPVKFRNPFMFVAFSLHFSESLTKSYCKSMLGVCLLKVAVISPPLLTAMSERHVNLCLCENPSFPPIQPQAGQIPGVPFDAPEVLYIHTVQEVFLSVMVEMFCICAIHYGSFQLHVTFEHWKWGCCDWGTQFLSLCNFN